MKIQWEYDFVEKPFREQLQTMGWTWIEGDVDVPELTERGNFRDVLLKERLGAGVGFNSVPGPPALLRNFGAAAPQALCRRATIA